MKDVKGQKIPYYSVYSVQPEVTFVLNYLHVMYARDENRLPVSRFPRRGLFIVNPDYPVPASVWRATDSSADSPYSLALVLS